MTTDKQYRESVEGVVDARRAFLKKAAVIGTGAAAATAGFGFNIASAQGKTTTWKIQTSWPGGIGLDIFKDWCNGIVEKTDGELAFKPFGAKDVVGDFQLFDAVKNGVLEAIASAAKPGDLLMEFT